VQLRDYQLRAIAAVREHYRSGLRRVLLVGATGFGKTATASALMAATAQRGRRSLFVVHRREIVLDTARRLREQGLRVGVVMAGVEHDAEAVVQVASVQTIAARDLRIPADLVVWDEAHHVAATTYATLREQYPQAWHLGLTATPMRADGAGLADAFERLVVAATTRELQERGFLVECDALVLERSDGIVPAEIAYYEHAKSRSCVIFASSVARGREIAERLAVPLIHGGTSNDERAMCLDAFAAGELPAIVNVNVLTEGWDCARADTVILERNCGSVGMYLQIVGRVLRADPGNPQKRALLIDLGKSVRAHGMPDEDRVFSLDGKPITRAIARAPSLCRVCGASRRIGEETCWKCGTPFPRPAPTKLVADTDLVPYAPAHRIATTAWTETKAVHLRGLERTCAERGYKRGWVAHRFRQRWGHWPWEMERGAA